MREYPPSRTLDENKRIYKERRESFPCHEERNLSFACLEANDYVKDKCQDHFDNYKYCLSFWKSVALDRKRKGIIPHMPPPEERQKIKEDFFCKVHSHLS